MDNPSELADTVRTAVLDQFARGELKLPIPPEIIQPLPDGEPEHNGLLHSWRTRRIQAKLAAALLKRRGNLALQYIDGIQRYVDGIQKKLLPANTNAVELICSSALAVLDNEQIRRQAIAEFQLINHLVQDARDAMSEVDGAMQDELARVAAEKMKERFLYFLNEIGRTSARVERRK